MLVLTWMIVMSAWLCGCHAATRSANGFIQDMPWDANACAQLRENLQEMLYTTYKASISRLILKEMLPTLVEPLLPAVCRQAGNNHAKRRLPPETTPAPQATADFRMKRQAEFFPFSMISSGEQSPLGQWFNPVKDPVDRLTTFGFGGDASASSTGEILAPAELMQAAWSLNFSGRKRRFVRETGSLPRHKQEKGDQTGGGLFNLMFSDRRSSSPRQLPFFLFPSASLQSAVGGQQHEPSGGHGDSGHQQPNSNRASDQSTFPPYYSRGHHQGISGNNWFWQSPGSEQLKAQIPAPFPVVSFLQAPIGSGATRDTLTSSQHGVSRRARRQSSASDVVTFGDIAIPADTFNQMMTPPGARYDDYIAPPLNGYGPYQNGYPGYSQPYYQPRAYWQNGYVPGTSILLPKGAAVPFA